MKKLYIKIDIKKLSFCCFLFVIQILKETVSVETTEKKETLLYNAYLLAGVIGFAAAVILGLVSLPSVAKSLSWQEFRLIQVKTTDNVVLLRLGDQF